MAQSDGKLICKRASHYILNCTGRGFRLALDNGMMFCRKGAVRETATLSSNPWFTRNPFISYPTNIVILTLAVNNNRLYIQSEIQKIRMMVFNDRYRLLSINILVAEVKYWTWKIRVVAHQHSKEGRVLLPNQSPSAIHWSNTPYSRQDYSARNLDTNNPILRGGRTTE